MRHRKVRGEKALLVSANQTLKELKIQVRKIELLLKYALDLEDLPELLLLKFIYRLCFLSSSAILTVTSVCS